MRASDTRLNQATVARFHEVGWDRFGSVVLKGITFGLRRGERIAVSGPQGSGKTTLLRLLGALSIPTSGTAVILSTRTDVVEPAELLALRSRMGFIHPTFHASGSMTVEEVISQAILKADRSSNPGRRVAAWLTRVGLDEKGGEFFQDLSVEDRLRAVIARTMVSRPDLLLADDPASDLPGLERRRVNRLLFDLCEERGATLVTSVRDLDSIPGSATRLLGLSQGSLILDEQL